MTDGAHSERPASGTAGLQNSTTIAQKIVPVSPISATIQSQ